MKFDPEIHHRRSIRLKGYDYALPGAYFVTLVTQAHQCLFGEVVGEQMFENRFGKIVRRSWRELPNHYPYLVLDSFIVMPNHIHGIIVLKDSYKGGSFYNVNSNADDGQTRPYGFTGHGLPEIVRAFKSFSARRINQIRHMPGVVVWQRNYYERIIRDEKEWDQTRLYIIENPHQWVDDPENPL